MEWLEEIRIRTTGPVRDSVLRGLVGATLPPVGPAGLVGLRIYGHAQIPTDLCVHLFWRLPALSAAGSEPGQQLVAGLQAVGMVRHSIWKLEESVSGSFR